MSAPTTAPADRAPHRDPAFRPLVERFRQIFTRRSDGGGALAVYVSGQPVVDVWAGYADVPARRPWKNDTIAMSYSTSKGVLATLLHRLIDAGRLDAHRPIAAYWPEFAAAGKKDLTVADLLTHRTGLHSCLGIVDDPRVFADHHHMAEVLAARRPATWVVGKPAYHAITWGWLVGGLIERVSGRDVRVVLADELAAPLDADGLFIGAPLDQRHRVAALYPDREPPWLRPGTLAPALGRIRRLRAFTDALLVQSVADLLRSDQAYDLVVPSANGTFTARSLARMYAALANGGRVDGTRLLSEDAVDQLGRVQTRARDRVLGFRMRWRLGYHQAFTTAQTPPKGFGHYGLGGSGAWADPETGLAIAFTTNRMGAATTPVGDLRLPRLGAVVLDLVRRHQV